MLAIVAVSEGWPLRHEGQENDEALTTQGEKLDSFGHSQLGGVAERLAHELEQVTGFETRHIVLGYLQRGGTPTAYDRILSTRYGLKAAKLICQGSYGLMAALRGTKIVGVPLADAVAEIRTVPREMYALAEAFYE